MHLKNNFFVTAKSALQQRISIKEFFASFSDPFPAQTAHDQFRTLCHGVILSWAGFPQFGFEDELSFGVIDRMRTLCDDVWLTETLLSPDECASLIEQAETNKFYLARKYFEYGRHNQETFLRSSTTVQQLTAALQSEVCRQSANFRVLGLRETLECYKYRVGDYVVPHQDAPTEIQPSIWSTFTLVVYLSDDFQGGETVFPDKGLEVRPRVGQAVGFKHCLLHAGATVLKGTKYIVRTNVAVSGLPEPHAGKIK